MYGWRAKIGLIIPENNVVMEHEFNKLAPEGVSVHSTRVFTDKKNIEKHEERESQVETISAKLCALKPHVVIYAIDSGSFYKGVNHNKDIAKKISNIVKVPASTTATSVIQAFKTISIKKIDVITPFPDEINIKLREFMEGNQIDVSSINRIDESKIYDDPEISPESIYTFVKDINTSDSDAIYISCTNLRTI